ncbi:MAG: hypothetical protein IIA85_03190 [Nanoarchaeota archaeon]|nr:hypothetical protein [Nanoarchaeota archaeon]
MNKKAFLLAEETLKIVIALISISFLIYFLSSLYFTNQNSKDLELAEATLENLIESANSGIEEVEIYNPKGWILISFPIGDSIMPNSCSNLGFQSCLCICNEDPWTIRDSGLAEDCDDIGICMDSSLKVDNEDNKIKLENPPFFLSIKENKKITKK